MRKFLCLFEGYRQLENDNALLVMHNDLLKERVDTLEHDLRAANKELSDVLKRVANASHQSMTGKVLLGDEQDVSGVPNGRTVPAYAHSGRVQARQAVRWAVQRNRDALLKEITANNA